MRFAAIEVKERKKENYEKLKYDLNVKPTTDKRKPKVKHVKACVNKKKEPRGLLKD